MTELLIISLMFMRLTGTVFSWLQKKAISMALWTKASFCGKSSLLEQSLPRTPSWQKRSLPTFKVDPRNLCNLCNLWLKKDSHTYALMLLCLVLSTLVESALQIDPFLCKTNPISGKSNERKCFCNNELRTKNYEL